MAEHLPKKPSDRHGFKIGIICALSLEAEMVEEVFDKRWDNVKYGKAPNDSNAYTTGVISGHNVVLAYCPGMGNISAAQTASMLMSSFTNVKIALVVGICGAVPFYISRDKLHEIVLGDCCISTAVIQFDLGRKGPSGFAKKDGLDGLGRANTQIRSLMSKLQTSINKQKLTMDLLVYLQALNKVDSEKTKYPGAEQDLLYKSSYVHTHQTLHDHCEKCNVRLGICDKSCKDLGCEDQQLERRKKLDRDITPSVHFGYFGSSNTVLKSGLERDQLAKTDNIIAFEMEGAGVWDICPTIVIKSACDYADSHKNKKWQTYAAAVAAAGLKALLQELEFHDEMESSKANRRYVIPFLENRRFVGREDKLAELEQRLLSADIEARQLAIVGLGGVGKSQLALAFCYAVKQRYPEYSIFWLSALSAARFKQDYIKIAKACSLPTESKEDDVMVLVQEHLSSEKEGKWLLIVDNADDKDILFNDDDDGDGIFDKLPQNEAGITIFTTRYRDIAVDLTDGILLDLEEMSMAEAELFLTKSLKRYDLLQDVEVTRELLEALACLPLAIVQATSYIIKTSITASKYLALMKNTEEEMIRLLSRDFRDNTRDRQSPNAVAVTWLVSFQRIKEEEEPMVGDLLYFLAFLENKAIPLSILPPVGSNEGLTHSIGVLVGYSFLTRQGDQEIYDMHRLVHQAVKIWMQNKDVGVDQWRERVLYRIEDIFPFSRWENRGLWQEYTPHAIRVLENTKQSSCRERARLCLRLGQCLEEDGRMAEAVKWISECVSWHTIHSPEDDRGRLISQHELARMYQLTGQSKKATNMLERVVEIGMGVLAEDDSALLWSQHELARGYLDCGREKEAVKILEKVVAIRELLAEDHSDRLDSQHVLARAYLRTGETKKGIEMIEMAVAIRGVLAEDHKDRMMSEYELALAYRSNGQVEEAIEILERIVSIGEKVLAEEHLDRLRSQHHLAVSYLDTGQTKQAIEILEAVNTVGSRVLAEYHTDLLATQHELAQAYFLDGRMKEAIKMLENVVAVRTRAQIEDNPDGLISQKVLANLYEVDGHLDQAIPLMQHVVCIRRQTLSVDHPDQIRAEADLSRMLSKKENDAYVEEGYFTLTSPNGSSLGSMRRDA